MFIISQRNVFRVLPVLGVVCLLLMATPANSLPAHMQMALFCGGILLVIIGFLPMPHFERRAGRGNWPLAAIILLAFAVRIYNLENAVHLFVDEMAFSNAMVDLRQNPNTQLLSPMNGFAAFTWFFAYLQAFSVDMFGPDLMGLRMVSGVFGVLTVAAVYLLAVQLFDRPTALLAAMLLATFPPHIHISRLGLNNIADPFFGVMALAFLARGLRSGGIVSFVLAGVMLGLTQYWYEGGRLLYPALTGVWLLSLLFRRRITGRQAGVVVGMALVVAAPLLLVLADAGLSYTPRLDTMGLDSPDLLRALLVENGMAQVTLYLREQFDPALLHLFTLPDASAFYYGGHTALILPYLLPFFGMGVLVLLWRRRFLLLVWIIFTVFGNSLIDTPGWTIRYAVVLPALVMVVAVGVVWLIQTLSPHPQSLSQWDRDLKTRAIFPTPQSPPQGMRDGKTNRRWVRGGVNRGLLLIVIVSILALPQLLYYFGPHLNTYNAQIRPFRDHQDVIWRSREFPAGTHVLLFTDELVFYPHFEGMMRYWGIDLHVQSLHPLELLLRSPSRLPTGADLAVYVQPGERELLEYLSRTFDLPPPQHSPFNVPADKQYVLYYIDVTP